MIAFKCPKCGKAFSVKDEFAGRKTKCPKDGTLLVVPSRNPLQPVLATAEALANALPADQGPPACDPEDRNCLHCKYRLPRRICGQAASENYRQQMEPKDVCKHFGVNPARAYLDQAEVHAVVHAIRGTENETTTTEEIRLFETAIRMGLPEDDEATARFFLAGSFHKLFGYRARGSTLESIATSPLLAEALKQLEHAAKIDSAGGYGTFNSGPSRASLTKFDMIYPAISSFVAQKRGAEAAIAYMEDKLSFFQHLRDDPMCDMLFELGTLYAEDYRDNDKAWSYFERVVHAAPIRGCEAAQEKTKQMAKANLKILAERRNRV